MKVARKELTRWQCDWGFVRTVAGFEFMPWNEIPIENKHARVTKANVYKHLRPPRVSLSNRLELFRAHLRRYGRTFALAFERHFNNARHKCWEVSFRLLGCSRTFLHPASFEPRDT